MYFNRTGVQRKRYDADTYDGNGDPVAQDGTNTPLARTSVQPADADDLELLPEGWRTRRAIRLYLPAGRLRAAVEGNPSKADLVWWSDTWWEVGAVTGHRTLIGQQKVIAAEVNWQHTPDAP